MLTVIDGQVCLDPRSPEFAEHVQSLRNLCGALQSKSYNMGICGTYETKPWILKRMMRRWSQYSGDGTYPICGDAGTSAFEAYWQARCLGDEDGPEAPGALWDTTSAYGRRRWHLLYFIIVETLTCAYVWKFYTWQTALRDCGLSRVAAKAVMFGATYGNGAFPQTIERQLAHLRLDELQSARRFVDKKLGR